MSKDALEIELALSNISTADLNPNELVLLLSGIKDSLQAQGWNEPWRLMNLGEDNK